MIAEIRHKTNASVKPVACVMCAVCDRNGPKVACVPGDWDATASAAESAAQAKGWTVHWESVRTPVRKWATGSYSVQYFCPKHKNKAGTVKVFKDAKR